MHACFVMCCGNVVTVMLEHFASMIPGYAPIYASETRALQVIYDYNLIDNDFDLVVILTLLIEFIVILLLGRSKSSSRCGLWSPTNADKDVCLYSERWLWTTREGTDGDSWPK